MLLWLMDLCVAASIFCPMCPLQTVGISVTLNCFPFHFQACQIWRNQHKILALLHDSDGYHVNIYLLNSFMTLELKIPISLLIPTCTKRYCLKSKNLLVPVLQESKHQICFPSFLSSIGLTILMIVVTTDHRMCFTNLLLKPFWFEILF